MPLTGKKQESGLHQRDQNDLLLETVVGHSSGLLRLGPVQCPSSKHDQLFEIIGGVAAESRTIFILPRNNGYFSNISPENYWWCMAGNTSRCTLHNPVTLHVVWQCMLPRSLTGGPGALLERTCLSGQLAGVGAERGLPAAELLPVVPLVVAGRDQGGVS
jgi:hypothetical protein